MAIPCCYSNGGMVKYPNTPSSAIRRHPPQPINTMAQNNVYIELWNTENKPVVSDKPRQNAIVIDSIECAQNHEAQDVARVWQTFKGLGYNVLLSNALAKARKEKADPNFHDLTYPEWVESYHQYIRNNGIIV